MQYGLAQAKARLSELTHLADAGEEVIIAKHGRPSYRLVPITHSAVGQSEPAPAPARAPAHAPATPQTIRNEAAPGAVPTSLADVAPALAQLRRKTRQPLGDGSFVAGWRLADRY